MAYRICSYTDGPQTIWQVIEAGSEEIVSRHVTREEADYAAHNERCADIAKSHWRHFESADDHAERVAAAEDRASWYFAQATVAQKAAYDRAMADLRGMDAPLFGRARRAAERDWYASTAAARDLYELTFEDLMRDGEVSETTSSLWDALEAPSKSEAA